MEAELRAMGFPERAVADACRACSALGDAVEFCLRAQGGEGGSPAILTDAAGSRAGVSIEDGRASDAAGATSRAIKRFRPVGQQLRAADAGEPLPHLAYGCTPTHPLAHLSVFLNRLQAPPWSPADNRAAVDFRDLLVPPRPGASLTHLLVSSYTFDPDILAEVAARGVPLVIVKHWDRDPASGERAGVFNTPAFLPFANVTVVHPPFPRHLSWGTMHSKLVLARFTCGTRVAVTTSNLAPADWSRLGALTWVQTFPFARGAHEDEVRAAWPSEAREFAAELEAALCDMAVPDAVRAAFFQHLDMSAACVRLVRSTPQRHGGAAAARQGIRRLAALVAGYRAGMRVLWHRLDQPHARDTVAERAGEGGGVDSSDAPVAVVAQQDERVSAASRLLLRSLAAGRAPHAVYQCSSFGTFSADFEAAIVRACAGAATQAGVTGAKSGAAAAAATRLFHRSPSAARPAVAVAGASAGAGTQPTPPRWEPVLRPVGPLAAVRHNTTNAATEAPTSHPFPAGGTSDDEAPDAKRPRRARPAGAPAAAAATGGEVHVEGIPVFPPATACAAPAPEPHLYLVYPSLRAVLAGPHGPADAGCLCLSAKVLSGPHFPRARLCEQRAPRWLAPAAAAASAPPAPPPPALASVTHAAAAPLPLPLRASSSAAPRPLRLGNVLHSKVLAPLTLWLTPCGAAERADDGGEREAADAAGGASDSDCDGDDQVRAERRDTAASRSRPSSPPPSPSAAGHALVLARDWCYVGSHNASASAWGQPERGGEQLRVNNYELGVVLPPVWVRVPLAPPAASHPSPLPVARLHAHGVEVTAEWAAVVACRAELRAQRGVEVGVLDAALHRAVARACVPSLPLPFSWPSAAYCAGADPTEPRPGRVPWLMDVHMAAYAAAGSEGE